MNAPALAEALTVAPWALQNWSCSACGRTGKPGSTRACMTCRTEYVRRANLKQKTQREATEAICTATENETAAALGLTARERNELLPAAIARGVHRYDLDADGVFLIVRDPAALSAPANLADELSGGIVPCADVEPLPDGVTVIDRIFLRGNAWYAIRGETETIVARRQRFGKCFGGAR